MAGLDKDIIEEQKILDEVLKEINPQELLSKYGNEIVYKLGQILQELSVDDAMMAIFESENTFGK